MKVSPVWMWYPERCGTLAMLTAMRRVTRLKVPHMGWNSVVPVMDHPLWQGIEPGERFYFVHSYHVVPTDNGVDRRHL